MSQEAHETVLMEYKGYIAEVKWNEEDGFYYGDVVNMLHEPFFWCSTLEEAAKAMPELIDFHLKTCKELGIYVPPPAPMGGGEASLGKVQAVGPADGRDGLQSDLAPSPAMKPKRARPCNNPTRPAKRGTKSGGKAHGSAGPKAS